MRIAIIGAGIAGLLPAYYLSKLGNQVTVYDSESYSAMRTSFANGGQVSVSNSEVWTSWNNIAKAIKWLGKKDAPLLIGKSFDLAKIDWLYKFLKHTARNTAEQRTARTIKLGLESRILYKKIIKEENLQFDQSASGILHFYRNNDYYQHACNMRLLYEANGCEWSILSKDQVMQREPTLSNTDDIVGGIWTNDDWTGDIHKFCTELTNVLQTKYNVEFKFNTTINYIEELDHDIVIVANGVDSVRLARTVGDKLDVYPVKGYSITVTADDETSKINLPKTSLLDDQAKIVTSTLGNRLRVAGTAELAGYNYDIRHDRIKPLLEWTKTNLSAINRTNYSSWACLRPMTPDMMPVVHRSLHNSRVFYHTGHGHLGWTLSPATAQNLVTAIYR